MDIEMNSDLLPPNGMMRWAADAPSSVPGLLAEAVRKWPDNVFLEFGGKTYSYAQFDAASNRLAHGLKARGVEPGETVATILDNSDDAVLIWFAINKIGAVSVPLNTALKGEFLRHQLADSRASLVIAEAGYTARIKALSNALPDMRTLLQRGDSSDSPDLDPFTSLWSDDESALGHVARPADLAMLVYTSGTTGPSKGCMIGHNYLCHFAREQAWAMDLSEMDVNWTALPLFHLGAIGAVILTAVATGSQASVYPQFSLSNFWPEIKRSNATVTLAPSSIAVLVAEAPESDVARECFGQLRVVSGVPFSPAIAQKWRDRFGVRHVGAPGYGMTELSMITLHPLSEASPPGSSGRLLPDVDVRILDDAGEECPVGTIGEVVVRPRKPNIMFSGYWGRPDATVEAFRDLWFHTGDLGRVDEDGFFFFADRKKDYIRRRGENISSFEVEHAFQRHPAIKDIAAHAVLSAMSEDDVKVSIVLNESHLDLSEEDLCRWSLDELPYYAVPRYIEFREDLPRNPVGKIMKFQLRDEGVTPRTWDRELCPTITVKR
jgi:carnitine-CoA ligase